MLEIGLALGLSLASPGFCYTACPDPRDTLETRPAGDSEIVRQEIDPKRVSLVRDGIYLTVIEAPFKISQLTLFDLTGRRIPVRLVDSVASRWRMAWEPVPGVYVTLLQGITRKVPVKFMVDR